MGRSFEFLKLHEYASLYILGINVLLVNHRKCRSYLPLFSRYHFNAYGRMYHSDLVDIWMTCLFWFLMNDFFLVNLGKGRSFLNLFYISFFASEMNVVECLRFNGHLGLSCFNFGTKKIQSNSMIRDRFSLYELTSNIFQTF
jgi:hypothetical protein